MNFRVHNLETGLGPLKVQQQQQPISNSDRDQIPGGCAVLTGAKKVKAVTARAVTSGGDKSMTREMDAPG